MCQMTALLTLNKGRLMHSLPAFALVLASLKGRVGNDTSASALTQAGQGLRAHTLNIGI